MKTNLLSFSVMLVIISVILMDLDAPQLTNNLVSYSLMGLSAILFTILYIYDRQREDSIN